MEAPSSITISLRFTVGAQTVVATVGFERGEDASEVLRRFFADEAIPAYLHDNILNSVRALFKEQRFSQTRQSQDVLNAGLMTEQSRLLARQFRATTAAPDAPAQALALPSSAPSVAPISKQTAISMYDSLSKSAEARATLAAVEGSYARAIAQLLENRDTALVHLRDRQAQEMEQVSQALAGDPTDAIGLLVAKHVQEIDRLEKKWENEIREAKYRQKEEYLRFLADSDAPWAQASVALPQTAAAPNAKQTGAAKKGAAPASGKGGSFLAGLFSATGVQAQASVAVAASPTKPSKPADRPSALPTHLAPTGGPKGGSGGSESDGPGSTVSGPFTVVAMLGSQLKAPYQIQVISASSIFDKPTRTKKATGGASSALAQPSLGANGAPTTTDSNASSSALVSAYSNALSASVLLTDGALSSAGAAYKDFLALASQSTEFLFDDFQTQIENAKREWNKSLAQTSAPEALGLPPTPALSGRTEATNGSTTPGGSGGATVTLVQPMKTGDFVISTHSNVPGVNVVFHMAVEKKNNASTTARLLAGLRNVLTVASQYDIASLTFPVLLMEPEYKHLFSDAQCIKRAEAVIREVRGFLVEAAGTDSALRSIRLLLPPSPPNSSTIPGSPVVDLYAEVTKMVSSTFNPGV